jgi:hypothetical protein
MSLTVKVARTFLSRGRGERSTLRRGRHDGLLAGMAVSRRIHRRVPSRFERLLDPEADSLALR